MIRVFKQYYPIRNIFFVIGEGFVIYLSVFTAAYALQNTEPFVPDSSYGLKDAAGYFGLPVMPLLRRSYTT